MFDFIICFKNLAKIRKNAELSEKLAKFILNLKYPLLKNKFSAKISSFCWSNIEKIAVLNIYLDVCLSFKFDEL
jgi:hypothetical protein